MKLVSRKVPKTLEDETVSLLPEDPEDMVSSPCFLALSSLSLLLSKFIPLVLCIVFHPLILRPCFYLYRYPSPSVIVTPSRLNSQHVLIKHSIPHVFHFKPRSTPILTGFHRLFL